MSIESRIRSYEPVFREWQIKEYLGGGSGGQTGVYRIVRPHNGWEEVGALKVITIVEAKGRLQDQSEAFRQDYLRHRQQLRTKAEQEVQLMYRLRDCAQVVNYQDYTFINWQADNSYGCDMLIRMEFLTSLETILMRQTFHESGVLRVGRDLTEALIRCHREGIIHRDIKPANIFVTANGDYKLGDFGIARILDDTQYAYTSIGTRAYAAPEQSRQETYDHRVDIYSLGLTLYELSNQGKLPFAESGYIRHDEVVQRLSGQPLPKPSQASPALAEVILKACAFAPGDRYPDARAFQRALEEAGQKRSQAKAEPQGQKKAADPYATAYARPGQQPPFAGEPRKDVPPPPKSSPKEAARDSRPMQEKKSGQKEKKGKSGLGKFIKGCLLVLLVMALMGIGGSLLSWYQEQGPQRYEYYVGDYSWDGAAYIAELMGGKLVTIDSKRELDYLVEELNSQGYQNAIFFLGGKRAEDASDYFWLNEFQLPEGEALNSRDGWIADLWFSGEPSMEYNGEQETCLTLEYLDGRWGMNDVPWNLSERSDQFSGRIGFIVEYED
ncbi:MAG: protein kinase [Ruminiclostridium sp.]|nr:protein kinase [Ruminiclostridium sp.]